jgi:TonB family protein
MKFCPKCHRQYADGTMQFCLDDGARLLVDSEGLGANVDTTLHLPGHSIEQPPTIRSPQQSTISAVGFGARPNAAAGVAGATDNHRSRNLLWIVVALIIGSSGIAIALIVMRGRPRDGGSMSQAGTSTASPDSNQNVIKSDSPAIESKRPANANETRQANRPPEKATPVPRSTPASKPTPTKAEVKEEQPSPPSRPPPRAPISGGVLNGKAVRLVQPQYPPIARSAHASGQVSVQITIDENGNVISAHAVSGHPLLQAAAVGAARASKFTPTRLDGQPVKVSGVIIYNFVAQ